jgi:hypothetical protein
MAANCAIQAVLAEMYGDEASSFAKFPALVEWFIEWTLTTMLKYDHIGLLVISKQHSLR